MRGLLALLLFLVATSAYGEIYTWKDSRGTVHFTNSLYEIPARYLGRAKLLDVPTGKKLPIPAGGQPAVAQPPGGAQAQQSRPLVVQPQPAPTSPVTAAPPAGTAGPTSAVPVVQPAPPAGGQDPAARMRAARDRRRHREPSSEE